MRADEMAAVLRQLYERELELSPDDGHLKEHSAPAFLNGTIQTFRFYKPYLPEGGRILDWGCRQAPDACLVRMALGDRASLDGCDILPDGCYHRFHEFAGLRYARLEDPVALPYAGESFDAVVAAGVLEHVPFDFESLRELHRVLKPEGRLMVTYLPNAWSIEEWRLRRLHRPSHERLYGKAQARRLLLRAGFRPLALGYQGRIDLLPAEGGDYRLKGPALRLLRPALRLFRLERLSSCLCAVAERA